MSNYKVDLKQIILEWTIGHIEKQLPNFLAHTDESDKKSISLILHEIGNIADHHKVSQVGDNVYYFTVYHVPLTYSLKCRAIVIDKSLNGIRDATELFEVEVPEPECFRNASEYLNFPNPPAGFRGMTFEKSREMFDPSYKPEFKIPEPPPAPLGLKPKGPIIALPQESTFLNRIYWLFFGD